MSKYGFKRLDVWKKAKELAINIYKITMDDKFSRDFGLRDQIRRSVVSVASNIAEGDERRTLKDTIRLFNIAQASLAELITQLEIAHGIGYLNDNVLYELEEQCSTIGKMLGAFIKTLQQKTRA